MARKFKFARQELQGEEYVGSAVVRYYKDGIEVVKNGWVVAEYSNHILRLLACNKIVAVFDVFAEWRIMEEIASKDINEAYEYLISLGAREIN